MTDRPSPSVEERLLGLVHRELGASEVSVESAAPDDEPLTLGAPLSDERWVVARFAEPPEDRTAMRRRLAILVSAFSHLFERETKRPSRVPPAQSLHGELSGLANRAQALDAIVVDAHSPVVWGSARGFRQEPAEITDELADALRLVDLTRHELIQLVRAELDAHAADLEQEAVSEPPPAKSSEPGSTLALTAQALGKVRALPEFGELRRGRPLRARERSAELGYVAHSFAGIYLLLLIFDGEFDELRAERAMLDAIGRIERLVLALPPRDPSPTPVGKVLRLPRRR